MPRSLGSLRAAALATCALSIAIAMPSGAVASGHGPGAGSPATAARQAPNALGTQRVVPLSIEDVNRQARDRCRALDGFTGEERIPPGWPEWLIDQTRSRDPNFFRVRRTCVGERQGGARCDADRLGGGRDEREGDVAFQDFDGEAAQLLRCSRGGNGGFFWLRAEAFAANPFPLANRRAQDLCNALGQCRGDRVRVAGGDCFGDARSGDHIWTRMRTGGGEATVMRCSFRLGLLWERVESFNNFRIIADVAPGAPTLTPVLGGLAVRWSAPEGRAWHEAASRVAAASYRATASPGGRSCTARGVDATGCTITDLPHGVEHTVTVVGIGQGEIGTAGEVVGDIATAPSAPSAPAEPGVRARPGAPAVTGLEALPGRIRIAWARPESDGFSRILGYTVTALPGGATCTTLGALTCDIDGLAPGVDFAVTVTATNDVGTGPPSLKIRRSTPVLVPSAPRAPLVRESFTRIEVDWSAPESDGGRPVTGYTATASPGGATCTTTGAKGCTIEGLASGTRYAVTVTATNEAGTGPGSEPASAMTAEMTVPAAPGRPSATPLPSGARVEWFAPEEDGGTPVTGYVATATPGGARCETTGATECVIRGLENGTPHRVNVVAVNTLGAGSPSPLSDAVTPQQQARAGERDTTGAFGVISTAVPALPQPADQRALLAGVALRPRTLVPGLGGRISYSLARPAAITITLTRGAGRGRDPAVHRIPAGRPGALAGDSRVRVIYTRASARRRTPGAWRMTVEARDATGNVVRRTIPIRVRT